MLGAQRGAGRVRLGLGFSVTRGLICSGRVCGAVLGGSARRGAAATRDGVTANPEESSAALYQAPSTKHQVQAPRSSGARALSTNGGGARVGARRGARRVGVCSARWHRRARRGAAGWDSALHVCGMYIQRVELHPKTQFVCHHDRRRRRRHDRRARRRRAIQPQPAARGSG